MKQSYPDEAIDADFMSDNLNISGFTFELRTIVGKGSLSEERWDESRWSHHGGNIYKNWWFDDNCHQCLIQLNKVTKFPYNDTYIYDYVKIEDINIQHMCDEFLRSIGGQIHIQCEEHRMPLI